MGNGLGLLLGAGLGVATAYYFDPVNGRRRRAGIQDSLVHYVHEGGDALGVAGRDMSNRAYGTAAAMRSSLQRDQVDDETLEARVRSCIGRHVSHPSSIEVEARDGTVTLSGPILTHEVPMLLDAVYGVRGVRAIDNELDEHDEPGNVPGLQGSPRPATGTNAGFMQENWTPSVRAIGTLAGSLTALYGLGQRGAGGLIASGCGLLLVARALSNLETRRLLGAGVQRHAVDIQKSLCIHAPVEKVFQLWDDFENFPDFMSHVLHVRRIDTGRNRDIWRWTVSGPAGSRFDFDAAVTKREENRLLAWRTEEGALVQHAGRVRFLDNGDGTTTVDVKMTYNPAAGAIGHAIARLFSADPKRQLDDDLMRMKAFLETGKRPHDAAGGDGREQRPEQTGEWPGGPATH